ncbi:MAG: ATP-binding protein [Gemmatimonadaceae bacterium]
MVTPTLTRSEIVERFATHRLLSGVPREELEWLAEHGVFRRYAAGEFVNRKGVRIPEFFVVLSGRCGIHVEERHGWRRVLEWRGGDFSGLMPYSRMSTSPGDTVVDEETEAVAIHESLFPEMIRACPHVTALAVHVMLDRARTFNEAQLQDEKMISLGRVAAGLAHELNNPASAAVRGAHHLANELREADAAARSLGAMRPSDAQMAYIQSLREKCVDGQGRHTRSPLEQADREEEIVAWLEAHDSDSTLGPALADTNITTAELDELARCVSAEALDNVVRWIASGCNTQALTRDIENTTKRIFELVSSIKRFTHMDKAQVADPVDVGQLIIDTVTVLSAKARRHSISLKTDIEAHLPKVLGFGGELNQVWMNLIDNALDAAPNDGTGSVIVSARREHGFVAVRVTDNGPGIPEDIRARIFDPFFTTKPPGEGTGLGLDIAQRIARRHRAEIDVASRPGQTEFRIGLPLGNTGVPTPAA